MERYVKDVGRTVVVNSKLHGWVEGRLVRVRRVSHLRELMIEVGPLGAGDFVYVML